MIPEFPKFKKLELSDKADIEKFTSKFPPYSDFNFVSIWSWDTKGEMRVSQLNNNLVIRFTDYLSGNPFFSFLGINKVDETIEALIEFSKNKYNKACLKLVPEVVFENSGKNREMNLDPDAFDYIYEVEHLANMHKWPQHTSGKNVRRFIKEHAEYSVRHFPIKEAPAKECLALFRKWAKVRDMDHADLSEYKAAERIFSSDIDQLRVVTLYLGDLLVGFTIYEIISKDYAVSHFAKSDKEHHKEVNDILNWEESKILVAYGIKYFNWEQDLGIEGLRKSKRKYNPVFYLKKYKINYGK